MTDYQIDPRVLDAIAHERKRQIAKWGAVNDMSPSLWLMVLGEEFGECCNAANGALLDDSDEGKLHLDAELIQVAAVAISWLEERLRGMSLWEHERDAQAMGEWK